MFLRAEVINISKSEPQFSDSDSKRINAFLDRKQKIESSFLPIEVNPKIFRNMMNEISLKENDSTLQISLQDFVPNLPTNISEVSNLNNNSGSGGRRRWVKSKLATQGSELLQGQNKAKESYPFKDLLDFVRLVISTPSLQNCLVLMKLLLTDNSWSQNDLAATKASGDDGLEGISIADFEIIKNQLSNSSLLDQRDFEIINQKESFKEHMATFLSIPRVVLRSGQPTKYSTYDVLGNVNGFIGDISIRAANTENIDYVYFEATLKGKSFDDLRIGWALCGSRLDRGELPGDSSNCWAYEPATMLFYHDSQKSIATGKNHSNYRLDDKADDRSLENEKKGSDNPVPVFSEVVSKALNDTDQRENKSSLLKLIADNFLTLHSSPADVRAAMKEEDTAEENSLTEFQSGSINFFNPALFDSEPPPQAVDFENAALARIRKLMLSQGMTSQSMEDMLGLSPPLGDSNSLSFSAHKDGISNSSDSISEKVTTTLCSGSKSEVKSSPSTSGGEKLSGGHLDQVSTAAGLVVGCLLCTKTKEMRFYHDGVLSGFVSVHDSLTDENFGLYGLCPTFYCGTGAGIELNIGQGPYRYAASAFADVSPAEAKLNVLNSGVAGEAKANISLPVPALSKLETDSIPISKSEKYLSMQDGLIQFQQNSHLTISNQFAAAAEDDDSSGSGIVLENVHTDSLKTMTFEASVSLSHPSDTFSNTTPTKWFNIISCGNFLYKTPQTSSNGEESKLPCEDCGCNIGVTDTGAIYFDLHGCETVYSKAKLFSPNKWHHVAVSYTYHRSTSKSNVSIFLDGAVVHQTEIMGNRKNKTSKLLPRNICVGNVLGKNATSLSSTFGWNGSFSQVRVWSVARSNDKVANHLGKNKLTGFDSDLLCYLTFDEGCGRTLHDCAINKNSARSTSTIHINGRIQWESFKTLLESPITPPLISRKHEIKDSDPPQIGTNRNISQLVDLVDKLDEALGAGENAPPILRTNSMKKQLLNAVLKKNLSNLAKILSTEPSKGRASPIRQFQNRVLSMKLFLDPSDKNLLLLNSILTQLMFIFTSSPDVYQENDISLLVLTALSVVNILQVLFKEKADTIPVSAKTPEIIHRLTLTLLKYISGFPLSKELSPLISDLQKESISAFVNGIDFFVPEKKNQFFILECLLLKYFKDRISVSNTVLHEVLSLLSQSSDVPLHSWTEYKNANQSDPLLALLSLSPSGAENLFKALSDCIAKPAFLAQIIPPQYRPLLRDPYAGPFNLIPGAKPTTLPSLIPRLGDAVVRGPHWRYGDQDGGVGTVGIVVDIKEWLDKSQPNTALTVIWKNQNVNTYRFALYDPTGTAIVAEAGDLKSNQSADKFNGYIYDVTLCVSSSSNLVTASGSKSTSVSKVVDKQDTKAESKGEDAPDNYTKKELQFTPFEVSKALIDDAGNGSITKRSILLYMRDNSPAEWQEKMKLVQSSNVLLMKLNANDIVQLYEQFYRTFSSQATTVKSHSHSVPTDAFEYLAIEPRSKFSSDQKSLHQRLLHFLTLLIEYTQITKSTEPQDLLISIQSLLVGVFETSDSFFSRENSVAVHKPSQLLVKEPFETKEGQKMLWNWKSGNWDEVPLTEPLKPANSKDAEVQSSITTLSNLNVDRNYIGANLIVTSRSRSVEIVHSGDREWNTCICTTAIQPNTGVHKWYVKIKNFSDRRGHCMVGVATSDFSYDEFLGQDQEGWGLSPNLDLFHAGRKRKTDSDRKLSIGCIIELTLDSNAGTLSFCDLTSDRPPDNNNPLFFDSLKGITVHPAFSLYAPGECISIITSVDDILRLRQRGNYSSSSIFRRRAETASNIRPQSLGAPAPFVINYAISMISFVCDEIEKQIGNESYVIEENKLISLFLPQLLASLYRWQRTSKYRTKHLLDHLGSLLCSIKKYSQLSLGRSNELSQLEGRNDQEILSQLVCITSALISKLLSEMIQGDKGTAIDNLQLALEMQKSNTTNSMIEYFKFDPLTGSSLNDKTLGILRVAPDNWLNNPLFSQGYLDINDPGTDILFKKLKIFNEDSSILISWVALHDRTHPNFKRFGGEVFNKAVNSLFSVNIFHSGFLSATVNIQRRLKEYLLTVAESRVSEVLSSLRPPMYLLLCWEAAMKVRTWGRELASKGIAYEFLVDHIYQRVQYLFGVEPCTVEQYYDNADSDFVSWLASSYPASSMAHAEKHILSISTNTKLFVTDSCSLVHLKVLNATLIHKAESRRDGLKLMRSFIDSLSTVGGYGAKCVLLNKLPEAIKGEGLVDRPKLPNELFQKSMNSSARNSSTVVDNYEGHYLSNLDGISKSLRMELQGAFDSLYDCLAQELSSNMSEDPCIQLCLIDCLGVRILEQDHTMLTRVNLFYILQDILENCMSASTFTLSSTKSKSIKSETSDEIEVRQEKVLSSDLTKTAVKAAMKLFILIALQVATAKDNIGTDDHTLLSFESHSSLSSSAPALRKSKSGPATLSKAVFDILFSQLHDVSAMMIEAVDQSNSEDLIDNYFVPVLFISQNSLMIISEATNLLLCVSKNSVCQQLLLKPKWLTLLLQMSNMGPSLCQQRSLQLLSDILPLLNPEELEAEVLHDIYLMTWLEKITIESWIAFSRKQDKDENFVNKRFDTSLPEAIVLSVLTLIGSMLTNTSQKVIIVTEASDVPKAIAELLLPIVCEAIGLLRFLYLSRSWHATVCSVLESILRVSCSMSSQALFEDTMLLKLLTAVLSVCGGHIDIPYLNSPVLFQIGDGPFRIGVFSDYHDSPEKIIVTAYDIGSNTDALPKSSTQEVLTVPLERVTAMNRCPIEKVQLAPSLLIKLTAIIKKLVLAAESAEARNEPKGAELSESKEDETLTLIEEKEVETTELKPGLSCPFTNDFKEFLVTLCARVFSTISLNKNSLISLKSGIFGSKNEIIHEYFSPSTFLLELLKISQERNRSCGLMDIPIYEEYLMILMRQRQKLWISSSQESYKKLISRDQTENADSPGVDQTIPESQTVQSETTPTSNVVSLIAESESSAKPSSDVSAPSKFSEIIAALHRNLSGVQAATSNTTSDSSNIDVLPSIFAESKPSGRFDMLSSMCPNESAESGNLMDETISSKQNINSDTSDQRNPSVDLTDDLSPPLPAKVERQVQSNEGEDAYEFPEIEGDGEGEGDRDDNAQNNGFLVDSLEGMGFPRKWCEIALDICGDDPEEALNYILTNGISLDEVTTALDRAESDGGGGGDSGGDRFYLNCLQFFPFQYLY